MPSDEELQQRLQKHIYSYLVGKGCGKTVNEQTDGIIEIIDMFFQGEFCPTWQVVVSDEVFDKNVRVSPSFTFFIE